MPPDVRSTALQFDFVCPLSSGMHARPASQLAEVGNNFRSEFLLRNLRNSRAANIKSVLSIIASDIRHGDRCSVQVSGTDEQAAQAAIRKFVEDVLPTCDVPLAKAQLPSRNGLPRVLQTAGVICYAGSAVSPGIARGKVVVVNSMSLPQGVSDQTASDPNEELTRLRLATAAVRDRIREKISNSDPLGNAVLRADLAMVDDVLLAQRIAEQVSRGKSAAYAVVESGGFFAGLLRSSGSEYLRERAADLEEISVQILEELYGADAPKTLVQKPLQEPSIVVAETLGPQQLLAFDRRWLKAIVIEHSGATSHALILARSLGIPAIVGVKNACAVLSTAEEAVVDANRGFIVAQISPAVERYYEREQRVSQQRHGLPATNAGLAALTKDGKSLEVGANASSADEVNLAFQNGADGIGLFRTEMSFLERKQSPSEEEQFAIYAQAARLSTGRPLIIRTLDVGGDKTVEYLKLPRDNNPFLGYRGARIYAEHGDLLQTQLRAILRASVYGRIQVIAPMISCLEEIRAFKAEITKAQQYLDCRNIPFHRDIPVGIMIEVPSVAFILDQLCSEVDFFSIGTNDLAQYFFAVDRDNSRVAALCNVLHPGFIRLLKRMVDEIHRAGKWVGMCGEMAGEVRQLPLLLGLGLDEISVPVGNIPELKRAVRHFSLDDCKRFVSEITACRERAEIEALVESAQRRSSTLPLLREDLILLDSDSRTKEEAIQELVNTFYIAARTHDRQQLEEAVWAREAVYSTGLGYGFAAPHCKTDAVSANSIGVLRLKNPIDWGAADHEPVRMVILIAMRELQTANGHMQVFSELARKLMNEEFREGLLALQDAPKMMQYLGEQLAL